MHTPRKQGREFWRRESHVVEETFQIKFQSIRQDGDRGRGREHGGELLLPRQIQQPRPHRQEAGRLKLLDEDEDEALKKASFN